MKFTVRLVAAFVAICFVMDARAETYALLIGINDYPTPVDAEGNPLMDANGDVIDNDLFGCVNDANAYKKLLLESYKVPEKNIRLLTDTKATSDNVTEALVWILLSASPGDQILFMFSGHGSQVYTLDDEEEEDAIDEVLVLYDGLLMDNDLRELSDYLRDLEHDVTIVLDSCFSGGMSKTLTRRTKSQPANILSVPRDSVMDLEKSVISKKVTPSGTEKESPKGSFTFIAAGQEDQPTMDVSYFGKPAHGAFTIAFLTELQLDPTSSINDLVERTKATLKIQKFDQVPLAKSSSDSTLGLPFLKQDVTQELLKVKQKYSVALSSTFSKWFRI